jgi:hypothetical protein
MDTTTKTHIAVVSMFSFRDLDGNRLVVVVGTGGER